jgi:hypothetical protein
MAWEKCSNRWVLSKSRVGLEMVYPQLVGTGYIWEIFMYGPEEIFGVDIGLSGKEPTLGEAKNRVEEYLDLIEEY